MLNSLNDSIPHPEANKRYGKIMLSGIAIIAAIALIGLGYLGMSHFHSTKAETAAVKIQSSTELIAAAGKVLMLRPGRTVWEEVKAGASLAEGDLIRTDSSGKVTIRYPDGTMVSVPEQTTLVVQNAGSGPMEIALPPNTPASRDGGGAAQAPPAAGAVPGTGGSEPRKSSRPSLLLQRIVPYGKSLELVGSIDAGSTLTVNDESVEVEGDGLFKHFTKLFPVTAGEVQLVLKATDLAGRINVITVTYDFGPHGDK
jgi:hypothetical protein